VLQIAFFHFALLPHYCLSTGCGTSGKADERRCHRQCEHHRVVDELMAHWLPRAIRGTGRCATCSRGWSRCGGPCQSYLRSFTSEWSRRTAGDAPRPTPAYAILGGGTVPFCSRTTHCCCHLARSDPRAPRAYRIAADENHILEERPQATTFHTTAVFATRPSGGTKAPCLSP